MVQFVTLLNEVLLHLAATLDHVIRGLCHQYLTECVWGSVDRWSASSSLRLFFLIRVVFWVKVSLSMVFLFWFSFWSGFSRFAVKLLYSNACLTSRMYFFRLIFWLWSDIVVKGIDILFEEIFTFERQSFDYGTWLRGVGLLPHPPPQTCLLFIDFRAKWAWLICLHNDSCVNKRKKLTNQIAGN